MESMAIMVILVLESRDTSCITMNAFKGNYIIFENEMMASSQKVGLFIIGYFHIPEN